MTFSSKLVGKLKAFLSALKGMIIILSLNYFYVDSFYFINLVCYHYLVIFQIFFNISTCWVFVFLSLPKTNVVINKSKSYHITLGRPGWQRTTRFWQRSLPQRSSTLRRMRNLESRWRRITSSISLLSTDLVLTSKLFS